MDKETDDPEQEQAMAQMRIDAYAVRVAFENVPAVTDMQRLNTLYDKFYLSAMYLLESMDPPLVNMFNPAFEE